MSEDKAYHDKQSVADRELRKFTQDENGDVAVNTVSKILGSIQADLTPSGLRNGGKITEVTLGDSTWTALPAIPLSDRNAMSIQNLSDVDIKINYDINVSGYVGIEIKSGFERYYDIKDTIIIYGRSKSGAAKVVVEELS